MCTAREMEIVSIEDNSASVSADGATEQVRLDIIDGRPGIGDHVIVFGGFALHRVCADGEVKSPELAHEMVDNGIGN